LKERGRGRKIEEEECNGVKTFLLSSLFEIIVFKFIEN